MQDGEAMNDGAAGTPAAGPASAAPLVEEQPILSSEPIAESEIYLEQLQRLQAEFSNFRKRITRDRLEWESRTKGELLAALIPILDDLDRAREAHAGNPPSAEAEGLLMILSRMEEALRSTGLERQIVEPGTTFDPHLHEAVGVETTQEFAEGAVVMTLQPGYLYREILLRPPRVLVAAGLPPPSSDPSGHEES